MTDDGVPTRGSLRSRTAATISAHTMRPLGGLVPPERAWGVWLSRQLVARTMSTFGPPLKGTRLAQVDTRLPDGRRVKGEWVHGPRSSTSARAAGAIYYVHGSGYVVCSPKTHRRLASWLSSLTGMPVFSIDYRLAPRHLFPTAADDVRAGWDWLVGICGVPANQIVVAGDSAGGHLIVDMLLQADVAAVPPAASVLLSPLYDVTFGLCLAREQIRRDPAASVANAIRLVSLYHSGVDAGHPRLKLNVASGPPLPPTLIQAGGAEMLQEDARQLAEDICSAGGECELQIWPDQMHVFQALPRMSPEAAKAMAHVRRFIANALREPVSTLNDTAAEAV